MKKNRELASIFNRIADALEFKGENVFKIIAYRKAARVLEELVDDVADLHKAGTIDQLDGIGKAIAEKIGEYLQTGKMKKFTEATKGIPPALLELLNIQYIGPKTLALANRELGVKDLASMKKAIDNGKLAELPMMGAKKAENIKKGILLYEKSHERLPINVALETADRVIAYLRQKSSVADISAAGSLRRWKENIGDIDILATGRDGKKIIKVFTEYPETEEVAAAGETKGSIIVEGGVQVDIRIVEEKEYGAALQYFTGSKAHNVKLRGLAVDKGLKLNEYGLFKDKRRIAGENEEGIYRALGLAWMPPELREDRGEIELALNRKLPKLIELADIKGDLQMHSVYSDSDATIDELATEAEKLGYEYILITDHSRTARYANGMELDRLYRQWEEIDRINRRLKGLTVLKGVEVDILTTGKLDYPDSVLEKLDIVVASVHQGFTKNVTERMFAAMENPNVDLIGHPTGRLISKREGYAVDIARVIEKAARTKTWLECNAYPDRLDLNDVNLKKAKESGVMITLGTDAHGVDELRWMKYGVATCRRGWLEAKNIVNTYPLEKLLKLRKK